ncbi:MAG: DUF2892 domain-containing protein [bacterium]
MNKFQNENLLDRLVRLLIAELLLVGGYYWLGGGWQALVIFLGFVMLFTAAMGFCGLYKLIGLDTKKMYPNNPGKVLIVTFGFLLLALPVVGSYYSDFFTKKFFIEDFNKMNGLYKQTLFNTGQDKRAESIDNYNQLVVEFANFENKYKKYKPVIIRGDDKFDADLLNVSQKLTEAKDKVNNGDLKALHKDLEFIRLVFQDILKRNNFSMIGIALVDFHDSMEVVIEAGDKKDSQAVSRAYPDASEKLRLVEEMANDEEIQGLRADLNSMQDAAISNKPEELPTKGAKLKASFIKVYLKRN